MLFLFTLLKSGLMPPKESGDWMDDVFDWCVDLLLTGAATLGISYNAINVIVFCMIWPALTVFLVAIVWRQRAKIRRLMADRTES